MKSKIVIILSGVLIGVAMIVGHLVDVSNSKPLSDEQRQVLEDIWSGS